MNADKVIEIQDCRLKLALHKLVECVELLEEDLGEVHALLHHFKTGVEQADILVSDPDFPDAEQYRNTLSGSLKRRVRSMRRAILAVQEVRRHTAKVVNGR